MILNDFTSISFVCRDKTVYCNLRFNAKNARFSTGIKVPSDEEFKNGWVRPASKAGKIAKQNLEYYADRAKGLRIRQDYDIRMVRNLLSGRERAEAYEFTLVTAVEYGFNSSKVMYTKSTITQYEYIINCLMEFLDFKGVDDVAPSRINVSLIKEFRDYMLNNCGVSPVTAKNRLAVIGSFYNTFYKDKFDEFPHLPNNPFPIVKESMNKMLRGVPAERQKRIQDYCLNEEQIKIIFDLELKNKRKERYKDMAMWQILTGFSFDDLLHYNWEVKDGGFILLNRGKTKMTATIPMLPQTTELYERLKSEYGDRIFPVDNKLKDRSYYKKYHEFLLWLSKILGMHLRSHLFRHTFGMLMNKAGATISDISDMLGHSSVLTTENYYISSKPEDLVRRVNLQLEKGLINLG